MSLLLALSLINYQPHPQSQVLACQPKLPIVNKTSLAPPMTNYLLPPCAPQVDSKLQPIKPLANSRSVTVYNNITKPMLGYQFCGTHYPDMFEIHVDNKVLKPKGTQKITITNQTVIVQYTYRFGSYRNGTKSVTFKLDPHTTDFSITFDWLDEYRILINNAQPVTVQAIAK